MNRDRFHCSRWRSVPVDFEGSDRRSCPGEAARAFRRSGSCPGRGAFSHSPPISRIHPSFPDPGGLDMLGHDGSVDRQDFERLCVTSEQVVE